MEETVRAVYHLPPTVELTPNQTGLLYTLTKLTNHLERMRLGFRSMSRDLVPGAEPRTQLSSIAYARTLWALKISVSLGNIVIGLLAFTNREDKTGGDLDVLVEVLMPIGRLVEALCSRYRKFHEARCDMQLVKSFSYAVSGTERYMKHVMSPAGMWWEDYWEREMQRNNMAQEVQVGSLSSTNASSTSSSQP